MARRQVRPDIARIAREPDVAGGNLERPAQDELPDEQERDHAAEALAAVRLAEVPVAATGGRHRRAELAPDHAVGDRDEHRHQPPEQGLRSAQRRHQDRDGDEGTDPNHVRHVERGRLEQAEAARRGRRSSFTQAVPARHDARCGWGIVAWCGGQRRRPHFRADYTARHVTVRAVSDERRLGAPLRPST